MLLGVVHRATVTHVDFDAPDGLQLDAALAEAAGFVEFEKLEVSGASNGVRFAAALQLDGSGTGALRLTGPTAYHLKPGDTVDLAAFGWMKGKAAAHHRPRVVHVDADNQPVETKRA